MGVRLNTGPVTIPEHWMLCNSAHSFRTAVANLLPYDDMPFRKVVERKDGTPTNGQWCVYPPLPTEYALIARLQLIRRTNRRWPRCTPRLPTRASNTDSLTPPQSTYNYGRALRNLYIDRLGFLPRTLSDRDADEQVYFRSTQAPRTQESLQQIMRGVYPPSTWAAQSGAAAQGPVMRVRNVKDENLSGNQFACPKLQSLLFGFAQGACRAHPACACTAD